MSKNWTKIETVNDVKNVKCGKQVTKDMNSLIRNTKTLSVKDLKRNSEKLYEREVAREDKLIEAYKEKKLKSKSAISEAKVIIKERKAAEAKKAKKEKEA